ncbi:hypothetical protein [Streptomyces sp. NPDC086787]|uniref:hypothetical protein n=1 Tax=Streptomyces sp. NPDC086787 TaxID=3365759 RepID=UPI00382CB8EE
MRESARRALVVAAAAAATALLAPGSAFAWGDDHGEGAGSGGSANGGASGNTLTARAGQSSIAIKQSGGESSKAPTGSLASVDPTWKPPACWYEPVATPEQLKGAVDRLKQNPNKDLVAVTPTLSWGEELMVDYYEKGKSQDARDKSYKNYNLGRNGMFWRGVINKELKDDVAAWDCERLLFWQDAGTVPDDPNAPTPKTLAAYAYNRIRVPDTEIELKPEGRSTLNLPTWVWLDKGVFQEVRVRAELPNTNLWAETTAKPVALHLEPGTDDAETYPASGDCKINDDGSIGTPYSKGDADKDPPCGISYLHATDGKPYQLKASVTWRISWEGTGGAKGDLPDGTFETTQDMTVQEIQAVNR